MRKTAAFITALLFTASLAGASWPVYAEDVPSEPVVNEETQSPENEASDNQKTDTQNSEDQTPDDENPVDRNPDEPEQEPEEDLLRKFAEYISENPEDTVNKLLSGEYTASDVLQRYFLNKRYPGGEEGSIAFTADLCAVILMDSEKAEETYQLYKEDFNTGFSRRYYLDLFIKEDVFTEFCSRYEIEPGKVELTESRDKNAAVTRFVQRIYHVLLGRKCETAGLNSWTGAVLSGEKTAADVFKGIVASDEFRDKNYSDEEYARRLMTLLFDREPEENEVKEFTDSTLAKGHTREAVLRRLVKSDECEAFCEKYGITRGEIEVGGWGRNSEGFKCWFSPETGLIVTGYQLVNNIVCYFDNEGTLRTDWSDLAEIVDRKSEKYSFMELERDIAELQQQYPALVHVNTYGITADGRQLYDIVIGSENSANSILVQSGNDGSEASRTRDIMADAENLLKYYFSGTYSEKSYRDLLSDCCIHILPMLNPDGISIAQYGLKGIRNDSMRARVRTMYLLDSREGRTGSDADEYFSSWKANARGVDLSKNTADYAASEGDISRPSSFGYPGPAPLSEAETSALAGFMDKNRDVLTFSYSDFSSAAETGSCALAVLLAGIVSDEEEDETAVSDETKALSEAGQKTASEYVAHLYKTVLGREPDEEGGDFWTQCLEAGRTSAVEIIRNFTESREFERRNCSDDDFVRIAYAAVCGREASADEVSRYSGLLKNGYSRSYVTSRLTETPDFITMCENHGVTAVSSDFTGWQDTSEGRRYWQNGIKVREDIRNLDGYTYYFDKKGRLGDGPVNIGTAGYYAKDGYVLADNGTKWADEIKKENIRSESGSAQKMDIPVEYQFLYTKVICTIGGVDKRVRESGCGAASASMVIQYLTGETKYNPEYLFEWAYRNGEYYGYGLAESTVSKFLDMAGIPNYWISPSADRVAAALRNGKPVISLVREGYFTTSGHYIVLTGITKDGYVTVNDPNNSSKCRLEYKLSEVLKQAKCFMICNEEESAEEITPAVPSDSSKDGNGAQKSEWDEVKTYVDTSSAVYTYESILDDVNSLKQQYPSLVNVKSLGTTADGRQVIDMIIGNRSASKQLVVQAGCHAREYMTCTLLMNQAENFLSHYWDGSYEGKSYGQLLDSYQIHIIPVLNPDGMTLSQKGLNGIYSGDLREGIMNIYRQDKASGVTNLGIDAYLKSWKANARGVDVNRNFATPDWADQGEIPRPSCAKYAGPSAASEEETQALQNLINSLSDCRGVISYHSSGSMIYWDYGQSGDFRQKTYSIAEQLKRMTGYYLVPGASTGGGCSDWVSGVKRIPAFTIEIGSGDSPLPLSQYAGIWSANRNVLPYLLSAL